MVKKWFPQNTFFSWFFTGRAFIMVYYIIKLDLEFQLDLQNPLKQPKMWIFEKWKIIVFGQSYGIFWPKGDLKPCIIMYLGNIHNMSLVPVTFGNFFFSNPSKMAKKCILYKNVQWTQNIFFAVSKKVNIFHLSKPGHSVRLNRIWSGGCKSGICRSFPIVLGLLP